MDPLDSVHAACERAEQLIAESASRYDILSSLVAAAEDVSGPGTVASILLLDGEGLLRNGASPNLPDDYLAAIDGLKPDPFVGTCAAAAATGAIVVTRDFLADGKWTELRHLPLALGFLGAWSIPIKSPDAGQVLGTFGTYFREIREPTPGEVAAVERLAETAARVLHTTAGE